MFTQRLHSDKQIMMNLNYNTLNLKQLIKLENAMQQCTNNTTITNQ